MIHDDGLMTNSRSRTMRSRSLCPRKMSPFVVLMWTTLLPHTLFTLWFLAS